ncbi:MAG: T9SS C-terminal target domain-containing protein [Ignavibacteriae bacterium]|nr:MAG: T9SS C-terminal target domain-containing protein [Ignavibacteriota bacterium]
MKKLIFFFLVFSILFTEAIYSQTNPDYTHDISAGPFIRLPAVFKNSTQYAIKAKVTNLGTSAETGVPVRFYINNIYANSTTKNLTAGQIDSVSFNWTTPDTGYFNIKIITVLAADEYRINDTVKATVYVYPGTYLHCIGTESFAIGYPFYTYYMDSKTDMLYTAAEIGSGGQSGIISKMGFYVNSAAPQVMNGFKIKLQNTTLSSISSFTQTGWSEVFSANYTVPGTDWQYVNLQNPFYYTGSNLLVEICFNNSSYTANSVILGSNSPGRVFHNHMDLSSGDGCVNIITGSEQSTLPNICFIITPFVGVNKNIQTGVPKEFLLGQNYPNPFNPETIISYQLPVSSNVKLIVYDALGKEIAILVNERLSPGKYETIWDASNYSSGVYYYRLECDNFTDVKKMVLIK